LLSSFSILSLRDYNQNINTVIPAQAGIQVFDFQKYLEITAIPNFWIPAYAHYCPE